MCGCCSVSCVNGLHSGLFTLNSILSSVCRSYVNPLHCVLNKTTNRLHHQILSGSVANPCMFTICAQFIVFLQGVAAYSIAKCSLCNVFCFSNKPNLILSSFIHLNVTLKLIPIAVCILQTIACLHNVSVTRCVKGSPTSAVLYY